MRGYFLETSVIVDYLRGREETVDLVEKLKGDLVSSYLCWAELFEGVWRVKNHVHAAQAVRQFFASLDKTYGVEAAIAEEFGRLRADLKKKGRVIEDMDLFIAATCKVHELSLVTNNEKHFNRVPGLRIAR